MLSLATSANPPGTTSLQLRTLPTAMAEQLDNLTPAQRKQFDGLKALAAKRKSSTPASEKDASEFPMGLPETLMLLHLFLKPEHKGKPIPARTHALLGTPHPRATNLMTCTSLTTTPTTLAPPGVTLRRLRATPKPARPLAVLLVLLKRRTPSAPPRVAVVARSFIARSLRQQFAFLTSHHMTSCPTVNVVSLGENNGSPNSGGEDLLKFADVPMKMNLMSRSQLNGGPSTST